MNYTKYLTNTYNHPKYIYPIIIYILCLYIYIYIRINIY